MATPHFIPNPKKRQTLSLEELHQEEARDILNVLLLLMLIIAVLCAYGCWWVDHQAATRALHESKIAPPPRCDSAVWNVPMTLVRFKSDGVVQNLRTGIAYIFIKRGLAEFIE